MVTHDGSVSREELASRIVDRVEYHGRRVIEMTRKPARALTSLELAERAWHMEQMNALTAILTPDPRERA